MPLHTITQGSERFVSLADLKVMLDDLHTEFLSMTDEKGRGFDGGYDEKWCAVGVATVGERLERELK